MINNDELVEIWGMTYNLYKNAIYQAFEECRYNNLLPNHTNEFENEFDNKISNDCFCLAYQIIDRFIFHKYGQEIREKIFSQIFREALVQYLNISKQQESLDEILQIVETRQIEWGKIKEIVVPSGIGGLLDIFSMDITRTIFSSLNPNIFYFNILYELSVKIHRKIYELLLMSNMSSSSNNNE